MSGAKDFATAVMLGHRRAHEEFRYVLRFPELRAILARKPMSSETRGDDAGIDEVDLDLRLRELARIDPNHYLERRLAGGIGAPIRRGFTGRGTGRENGAASRR